ncbi:MAG: AgmX/PglI C-terminal domain-containing protein, partial [Byssovorax sp.]
MKPSSCLALLALLPLGCGGATPAPTDADAVATSQRPTEVTVVDLAAPPAPKEQKLVKAPDVDPGAEQEAARLGMIGLLGGGAGGEPNALTAPWGKEDSTAGDTAQGNLWGSGVGDSFGAGGLGLRGVGVGGGGTGTGIGLGTIGTLGHGGGSGTGQGFGSGGLAGGPRSKPPQVKMGATTVTSGLPPEVIQRIVRQNFGRFRLCYEAGLRSNPSLSGRVATKFVIGRDGAVIQASDG